jgi:hypothetical protein
VPVSIRLPEARSVPPYRHGSRIDPLAFYSTSAQVIPVLFVVLAIEMRLLGRVDGPPEQDVVVAAARFIAFCLIVWGEWQALSVLSAGRGDPDSHEAVTTALVAVAIMVALEPASAFARSWTRAMPWALRPYARMVRIAPQIVVGVALLALGVARVLAEL